MSQWRILLEYEWWNERHSWKWHISHPSRSFVHSIVEGALDIDRVNRWLLPLVALARWDRGRCSGSDVRVVHSLTGLGELCFPRQLSSTTNSRDRSSSSSCRNRPEGSATEAFSVEYFSSSLRPYHYSESTPFQALTSINPSDLAQNSESVVLRQTQLIWRPRHPPATQSGWRYTILRKHHSPASAWYSH